jgi:hypothetical protein
MSDPKDFVMPIGRYRGQTLDDISSTDEGLLYLDWMVGQHFLYPDTKKAIEDFLGDQTIRRELDRLL